MNQEAISEFPKETRESTLEYITLQNFDLLGMVFSNACLVLMLENWIDPSSQRYSEISREIAKSISWTPNWEEYRKICRANNLSVESFERFRITMERAMECAVWVRKSVIKLLSLTQDEWFQVLEKEWPKFLENVEWILDTVKKSLNDSKNPS